MIEHGAGEAYSETPGTVSYRIFSRSVVHASPFQSRSATCLKPAAWVPSASPPAPVNNSSERNVGFPPGSKEPLPDPPKDIRTPLLHIVLHLHERHLMSHGIRATPENSLRKPCRHCGKTR